MELEPHENIAFYLNGRKPARDGASVAGLGLRPAVLAAVRDVQELRHDYPLVLLESPRDGSVVVALSALVDAVVADALAGAEGARLASLALLLEREMRRGAAPAEGRALSAAWSEALDRLAAAGHPTDDLERLAGARPVEGRLLACDEGTARRLVLHLWRRAQAERAARARRKIDQLVHALSGILEAAEIASGRALAADRLQAAVAGSFASDLDFDAMARVVSSGRPPAAMPAARRARIEALLRTLTCQDEFPPAASFADAGRDGAPAFVFDSTADALAAVRERHEERVALARAMLVATLEVEGTYREEVHGPLFDGLDEADFLEVARFPDFLVHVRADRLSAAESGEILAALASGVPIKVLLQTDDLLGGIADSPAAADLAGAAVGLGRATVLQASTALLPRYAERLDRALRVRAPALVCVYSGAGGEMDLPAYLAGAAATASRAFPAFHYDPTAGRDWASRFHVGGNPEPEEDWPSETVSYEVEGRRRTTRTVPFTFVDFVACDARFADRFARVPPEEWDASLSDVPELLDAPPSASLDRVPSVLLADDEGGVHRAVVSRSLVAWARRVRDEWLSLRELGGVRNSHAEAAVESEREVWQERLREAVEGEIPDAAVDAPVTEAPAEVAAVAPAFSRDEPRIETARCSTCNECIQINDRMFQYNKNKQAVLADLDAGTYAELVLAAERCQVAIIHPGKPRNPDEPGLEELLARAEPFR